MSTPDQVRQLTRQTRARILGVERLRTEQRIITAQTARRIRESRALLERSQLRRLDPAPARLRQV